MRARDDQTAPALPITEGPCEPGPCGGCGLNATWQVDGAPWHPLCRERAETAHAMQAAVERGAARNARPAESAAAVSVPETTHPDPSGPQRAAQRAERPTPARPLIGRATRPTYAPALPEDAELSNLAAILRLGEPGCLPDPGRAVLIDALDLFHRVTDWCGLESRSAGRVGNQEFHRLTARYGATPSPTRVELPAEVEAIRPKLLDPHWINPGRPVEVGGPDVIGMDVNGQYLAAAGAELGTGSPERYAGPGIDVMKLPGYGQLAADVNAPGLMGTLRAGNWVELQAVRYLVDDLSTPVELADGWVWREHRQWLAVWQRHWRNARAALLGVDSEAGRYALAAVKAIPTAFLGGFLRSTRHNRTVTLRKDWAHTIITRARMNALRGIRKAAQPPIAMIADTAFFLGMESVSGMEIPQDKKLGKWKV